jgi:hypothetical protein
MADRYNYETFPPEDDVEVWQRWPQVCRVGTNAPHPELIDLASGERARLSATTGRGLTVIELGSLT